MGGAKRYVLTALVAFAAALAATWAATWVVRSVSPFDHAESSELHTLVHEKLNLDAAQEGRIEVLEARFAEQRKALDAQMREANAALAQAIETEHQYGPRVAEAVDRSHQAMGELQKATLAHVFAMRAVLRPDQAARFDAEIGKTLTQSDRK
ncbi:periplasmic heavy metal sensor [Novosphingobium naphthalenivorans]|uniref:periplasmic heavy metal sensor n=1 Tax=Novosphingobium naphthalenivorans TaxID=273168 RepID=UPI00082D156F|nr:periplasmic heavy metal sensor [Novosphingobium naphthalenivorans]